MIPLKDQDQIRAKFAAELVDQVKIDYFTERELSITVPGKLPCQYCKPTQEMLQEIAGLSEMVSLRIHHMEDKPEEIAKYGVERVPATVMRGRDTGFVTFYGMPGGTEFPAFVECIVDISQGESLLSPESVEAIGTLTQDISLKVFVTPTCPYCPTMMRAAFQLALLSPHISAETIEVNEFPDLAEKYKVQAVPLTVINDEVAIPGMIYERQLVDEVMKVAGSGAGGPTAPGATVTEKQAPQRVERGKERPSGLFIP